MTSPTNATYALSKAASGAHPTKPANCAAPVTNPSPTNNTNAIESSGVLISWTALLKVLLIFLCLLLNILWPSVRVLRSISLWLMAWRILAMLCCFCRCLPGRLLGWSCLGCFNLRTFVWLIRSLLTFTSVLSLIGDSWMASTSHPRSPQQPKEPPPLTQK